MILLQGHLRKGLAIYMGSVALGCITREPVLIHFRAGLEEDLEMRLRLELEFMGHYGGPNLEIVHDLRGAMEKHGEVVKTVYLIG